MESLEETIGLIKGALRANETDGLTWEIIVCDNASTDNTSEIARRAGARVVVEPERGIALACNAGAGIARGSWLLFIDADSYPTPELLTDVRSLLVDESIVGCGSTMEPIGGRWWIRLRIERDNYLLRLWGIAVGVFLLCRHKAFRAIGGFSANLYAFEELDFVARLRRYGRAQGQSFPILHQHPVVTSARTKGGTGVGAFVTMFVSYTVAGVLLVLHTLLPKGLHSHRQEAPRLLVSVPTLVFHSEGLCPAFLLVACCRCPGKKVPRVGIEPTRAFRLTGF